MNGYLVILRARSDDYPLSLHATYDAALIAARLVAKDPDAAAASLMSKVGWRGTSDPDHVIVLQFEDGKPVKQVAGFEVA
jgi:hypothetical protein